MRRWKTLKDTKQSRRVLLVKQLVAIITASTVSLLARVYNTKGHAVIYPYLWALLYSGGKRREALRGNSILVCTI